MTQAEENIQEEIDAAKVCKRRVDHLKENDSSGVGVQATSPTMSAQWRKRRLDRMLVDHFLRSGYYNTAIRLARHSGIEVTLSTTHQIYGLMIIFFRVSMPRGKSRNCVSKISRTWKVLENESGPGMSWKSKWKVLEFARQWCGCSDADAKICLSALLLSSIPFLSFRTASLLFLCNMSRWWTYTPAWMLLSYHMYMISNCCLSLYLNIARLWQGPAKILLGYPVSYTWCQ